MQFPDYVPTQVQEFFAREIHRLTSLLERAERECAHVQRCITGWSELCEWQKIRCSPEQLRQRQTRVIRTRNRRSSRLDHIRRLAALVPGDDRMQEAYIAVKREVIPDGQLLRFVRAAYYAMDEYAYYREKKKLATELSQKLAHLHGGKSTGPRTAEGKARIAAAQRARWEAARAQKRSQPPTPARSQPSPSRAELYDYPAQYQPGLPSVTARPARSRYSRYHRRPR
jgi:hypothetical protein